MFDITNPVVKELLLTGSFGLEKESLRVTGKGFMAQSPTPFSQNEQHIVRDFSENQVEINTPVASSPQEVVDMLDHYNGVVQRTLRTLVPQEYLWPFSNPPYIKSEKDIPIAIFTGEMASKTIYREYLSDRYGRYKMAFSGIHFNYSFSDELLQADFKAKGLDDFDAYKNQLYVDLAQRAVAYGWIVTAITAASPVVDSSFVEKGKTGIDLFQGLSTVRGSELGYWNFFAPIFDYSNLNAYVDSIQHYADMGLIKYPSELYYPVRIKPHGAYGMDALRGGVSHIELRNIDLNPLTKEGIDVRDVLFCQLLLVWLASTPLQPFDVKDQVQAVQNFKNAAHFDLKTVKIVVPNGEVYDVRQAGINVIGFMQDFYQGFSTEIQECLDFQLRKFTEGTCKYSYRVRQEYGEHFVEKGLDLAKRIQEMY
ncbi:MAG: hypothetical protein Q4E12_01940 [Coriobacteriia bacterium]|nr:hypothetical protein [Coriobacteriia bacterium]